MKYRLQKLLYNLSPYRDVIMFVVTLFVANWFWKWTVIGDEGGEQVIWFGLNLTFLFDCISCHIASAVYWLISLFRDTVYLVDGHIIRFESGSGTSIVWSCSGIKQGFIWLCLILTVHGGWKQKLWFIPFGWLCCYAFNILRIFLIALLIEAHPDWFVVLHDYIFKYAFYAMLFGLWVWFVEKIRD